MRESEQEKIERQNSCNFIFQRRNQFHTSLHQSREELRLASNQLVTLEGELSTQNSLLDRILEKIRNVSASAVECTIGRSLPSCVGLIAQLTNKESGHRAEVHRLEVSIAQKREEIRNIESEVTHFHRERQREEDQFNRSRCGDFNFY